LTLHISARFRLDNEMKKQGAIENRLTVGGLARVAQVRVPTLRFYERSGLLPKAERTASNYRLYSDEAVNRIRFIRRAQQLGFTLIEIKELLNLRVGGQSTCAHIRERAEAKIEDIEERIRSLRRMSRALEKLVSGCGEKPTKQACPILERLEGHL